MNHKLRVFSAQTAIAVVLIAVWQSATSLKLADPAVLPAPATVAVTIGQLLNSSSFLADAGITLVRVAVAFVIGAPVALLVGFIMGENLAVGKSLGPIFNLVLAVPQSIFLPIFVLLLGLGATEKIVFGITHVFFVVVVNTMAAVREVPHAYAVAARSWGASRIRIYRDIYLPAMAPNVMTGLRFGLIFDIIGILLAEMYASSSGLGLLLSRWGENMDVGKLMAATILISVATVFANEALRLWETRVSRWQRAGGSGVNGAKPIVIETRNLRKVYDAGATPMVALEDVSISVPEGSFVSLVGPSGCGKSTLLQILAGLVTSTTGDVLVDGIAVTEPMPGKITVVFQDSTLLPWKTVAENVLFPLEIQNVAAAERTKRTNEMLALVGLTEFRDRHPHELSGGMRQRVSIARGLAQNPRIILMDEPFGALDEQTRLKMGHELLRIWEATGKTIFLITHSLTEALFLSDVVLVMSHRPGKIVGVIEAGLPRPRTYDMVGSPEFGAARNEMWRLISADDASDGIAEL